MFELISITCTAARASFAVACVPERSLSSRRRVVPTANATAAVVMLKERGLNGNIGELDGREKLSSRNLLSNGNRLSGMVRLVVELVMELMMELVGGDDIGDEIG